MALFDFFKLAFLLSLEEGDGMGGGVTTFGGGLRWLGWYAMFFCVLGRRKGD